MNIMHIEKSNNFFINQINFLIELGINLLVAPAIHAVIKDVDKTGV